MAKLTIDNGVIGNRSHIAKAHQIVVNLPKIIAMNYQELVDNHSNKLIDQFLGFTLSQPAVEVRFDYEDNDQWSIISMHQYEEDLEISIRLHQNGDYDLYVGYYDDEDEFHEIVRVLTEAEIDQLPNGLKKLMKKVVSDEQGLRIKGDFLKQ